MTKPMDHVAYLSQEIGPRPAGTEEEQQAALYVTERLQKDAHLSAEIEDFTCTSDAQLPRIICFAAALLSGVLALALPVAGIPAIIVAALAAAVYIIETFDHPVLTQAFMRGVSQNVVAKYEPTYDSEKSGARRRKVIVLANYDSGHVRRDLFGPFLSLRRPLQYAVMGAMALLPVVLLIRQLLFLEGPASIVFMVIAALLMVLVAVPLVFLIMERYAPYNEAANSNAAGVAVMLEVARRLGNGEVVADAPAAAAVHGESAARAAGVVPEGASISYETGAAEPEGGLAAAKAAIAAMTGVAPKERVRDIADNLVQVKEAPLSTPNADELSQMRKDTKAALSNLPAGTLAEAAAKAAVLEQEADHQARVDAFHAEEEAKRAAEEAAAAKEAAAKQAERQQPLQSASTVPDWYKKATEKARANVGDTPDAADAPYRSRFADVPLAHETTDVQPAEEVEGAKGAAVAEQSAASASLESAPAPMPAAEDAPTPAPYVEEAAGTEAASVSTSDENCNAAAPQGARSGQEDEVLSASATVGILAPDATSAMPAVAQGGHLDLDALRAAAAAGDAAAHSPEISSATAVSAGQATNVSAAAAPAPVPAEPAAETTRLPQMMYYNPPADRSGVIQERSQKDRVMVSASVPEVQDMATSTFDDFADAGAGAYAYVAGKQPTERPVVPEVAPADQPKVVSANIPVVDLPQITLPPIVAPEPKPISFDELRQRAPLANAETDGQEAAKSLLASRLPSISADDSFAQSEPVAEEPAVTNSNVSLTSSFAAIGAIGAEPVGDELLADVDPDDIYIEDADDSVFEEEFTETGAFAGPGYVEMPQSRMGKFFGKFRRKKNKDEGSAAEWLGVDEDFDARSAGKARGGWESFREEDDWQGGAFSSVKARFGRGNGNADSREHSHDDLVSAGDVAGEAASPMPEAAPVSHDAFAEAAHMAASLQENDARPIAAADFNEVQQIYSFAAGDINTEVWFVALGSDLAGNGGIKAFLAEHASDMRGAIIVNLEALGSGELCYLEREGHLAQAACSPRMKRFIKKASQASGVSVSPAALPWRESPASYAIKHRMQGMTLAGMDGGKPAGYCQADDVIENVDPALLDRAADFVVELLKNI